MKALIFLITIFALVNAQGIGIADLTGNKRTDLTFTLRANNICYILDKRQITMENSEGTIDIYYDEYDFPYFIYSHGGEFMNPDVFHPYFLDTMVETPFGDKFKVLVTPAGTKLIDENYLLHPNDCRFTSCK